MIYVIFFLFEIANVSYLVYVSVSFHVTNNGGSSAIIVGFKMNDPKTNY